MNFYLSILLWWLCQKNANGLRYSHNSNLEEYLNNQSEFLDRKVDEQIGKLESKTENLEQILVRTYKHTDNSSYVNSFSLFNKTFFIIHNEIFQGVFNNSSFTLEFRFNFPNQPENYIFFKTVEFKGAGFVAIGLQTGETLIYNFFEDKKKFDIVQTMSTPYVLDAIFFINEENLHLIITTNRGDNIAHTIFYKWLDSHFDEFETIYTTAAIKMSSFPYKDSEIIIILQNPPNNKMYSLLYEFQHNRAKKIQHLNINSPQHVDIFEYDNTKYVLLYDLTKNHSLYQWNGFELVLTNTFHWEHKVDKSIVVYSNSTPLIVTAQPDKVFIYKPNYDGIRLKNTKDYLTNNSVILDINKGGNENGNITFIVGLSEDNIINIYAMSFKVHPEMEKEQEDVLRKCFNNLEQKLYDEKNKLNQMKSSLSLVTTNSTDTKLSFSRKREATSKSTSNESDIESNLVAMNARLDKLRPFIMSYGDFKNDLIVNGKTIIKASILTKTTEAKNLIIKQVNEKKWVPEQWLKYKEPQTISGPVTIKKIITKVLATNPESDKLFKNLLIKEKNSKFIGQVRIGNISAQRIFTEKINNIDVKNIHLKNSEEAIKGLKKIKHLTSRLTQVEHINNQKAENILSLFNSTKVPKKIEFDSNVFIKNLWINSIDNIHWDTFKNSVFKIGDDEEIEGNLTAPKIKAESAQVNYINRIKLEKLLTKSTDQVITSSIEFNNILTNEILCNTANDINILKSAALDKDGTIIKGPIIANEIYVNNDLELLGKLDKSLFLKNGDQIFLQKYMDKVVIKGNLYVKDLSIMPNTTIFLNGNEFSLDIFEKYWRKKSKQDITVHFEATKGITTPHLRTTVLNTVDVNNFALNNNKTRLRTPLFFENVTVEGNVNLNKNSLNTSMDLEKLAIESVRTSGMFQINGRKKFTSTLKVKQLKTEKLNGINILEAKEKTYSGIAGKKVLKTLVVKGNLSSNVKTNIINNIEIKDLKNNLLALNNSHNVTEIEFKTLTVENLHVNNVNGHNVYKYLEKLEKMVNEKHIESVQVKGNVAIENVKNLLNINDHNIQNVFHGELSGNSSEPDLTGNLRFIGKVTVGNLLASDINNIHFPELTTRFLHKISNQTVSAVYTFNRLKAENVFVATINDKNVEDMIDVSSKIPQEIFAPNGITFDSIKFMKSLRGTKMLPCDLNEAVNKFKYPESQEWEQVKVNGNINILDENSDLSRILHKSMKKDQQNIVLAPVNITGHVLADNVQTSNSINNINLKDIIDDALLNDITEEQVISGSKMFPQLDVYEATVLENTDIPIVNQIFLPELFKRIVHKHNIKNVDIKGRKTFFAGIQTDRFYSNKVGELVPEEIVNYEAVKPIPKAIFDSLKIENNLNVQFVNNFNLNYILHNRLLVNISEKQVTNAVYFFKSLEIQENLKTLSINNIELKNVVFDVGKQKVVAPKRFLENITISGNATIDYINGINISETFHNALRHGHNEVISGSVTILKPVRIEGNISTETINGYPIQQIKDIMGNASSETEEGAIYNIQYKVKQIILDTLPDVQHMPNEFMYIEKSNDLQILVPNAIDARVTKIKNYALIHVLSEESNDKCNLPEPCKCPVQRTIEISPEHSVSYFLNKGPQRIYSYDDDTMTIHVITNSISTNSHCRTNQTKGFNEMSTMTWSSTTTKNSTGSFNMYPTYFSGYISGVEFFTIDGTTYVIIGRYYDPVADTHDLDCTVIRFSSDKTAATEIQKIPTQGAWTLYLLHTVQGVTLIIGNNGNTKSITEIYRFREETEKFELLRTVAYGCTRVVGVVLGTDSLIILANKNAPLQVLKYNQYFDNYYYYQMFALEEPLVGVSVFYVGGFGISDAYLCLVTEENYRIYSFQFIDGWKLESKGTIKGLRNLIPFELNNQLYLFAPSDEDSSLLTIVKHGAGET